MKFKANLIRKEVEEDFVEVIIEGDCNDGDYNTTINKYDGSLLEDQEFLLALHVLSLYDNPREMNVEDILLKLGFSEEFADENSEILDYFSIPSDDWGECHTITSIDIKLHKKDGIIYDVEIYDIPEEKATEESKVEEPEKEIMFQLLELGSLEQLRDYYSFDDIFKDLQWKAPESFLVGDRSNGQAYYISQFYDKYIKEYEAWKEN